MKIGNKLESCGNISRQKTELKQWWWEGKGMFLRFLENRIENNVILREAIWSSFHCWGPVRGGVRLDNIPGIL